MLYETQPTSKQVVDAIKMLQLGETPVNLVTAVIAQRWITAVAVMGLTEEWTDKPSTDISQMDGPSTSSLTAG